MLSSARLYDLIAESYSCVSSDGARVNLSFIKNFNERHLNGVVSGVSNSKFCTFNLLIIFRNSTLVFSMRR